MNIALSAADYHISPASYHNVMDDTVTPDWFSYHLADDDYLDGTEIIFAEVASNILKTAPNTTIHNFDSDFPYEGALQDMNLLDTTHSDGDGLEYDVLHILEEMASSSVLLSDNEGSYDEPDNNHQVIIKQVKEHMSDHILKHGDKISLHLYPEELGKISIEMDLMRKLMIIDTTNVKVEDILRSELNNLQEALDEHGLQDMNFTFQSNHDQKSKQEEDHGYTRMKSQYDQSKGVIQEENSIYLLDIFV